MILRTARARLTLWYTVALSIIILFFSGGIYFFVSISLQEQADRQLRERTDTIEKILKLGPDEMREEIRELMEFDSTAIFLVMDGNTQLAATNSWKEGGLDRFFAGNKTTPLHLWTSPNGRPYRLQTKLVSVPTHSYRITVAIDEEQAHQLMNLVVTLILIGIPAAITVAFAGGYFIAGHVLAPVNLMAAKAGEITAEGLADRLPVKNPDDEFGRLATVFNQTFARLEDSFERMRRFTSDASHELRTPLTVIRSVGEVGLQEDNDVHACREVIASMLEETDRLTRLVDSLLTLSRADAGLTLFERKWTDLGALAADVIDCLQVLAEEKGQVLTLDAKEPILANIDPSTFRQALINLLDNAVKYTPPNGRIGVAVRRSVEGMAVLEITDEGPGISRENHSRIFERFYRIDKGRSRDSGGAGLGLAITRWAVEVNGGRIEVESEEGRGSTFRIVLPV